jgi:DNA helicase MCM9
LECVNNALFKAFINDPFTEQLKWDGCLLTIQYSYAEKTHKNSQFLEKTYQIKLESHIRFTNLPPTHEGFRFTFPGRESLGCFVQIKGIVVRVSTTQFLETKKEFQCGKCKQIFLATTEYKTMYHMEPLTKCLTPMCQGRLAPIAELPKAEMLLDYQEVRLQEMASETQKPNMLIVSLENDMTKSIFPGECITVCGKYDARWGIWCQPNKEMEIATMLRATSIKREDTKSSFGRDLQEHLVGTRAQWEADIDAVGMYAARDCLVRSICPEVRGMYLVKLAIALSLATNVQRNGDDDRVQSHLLLVGDPGLAKSRLLKFAAKMVSRAVHTNGDGISVAGLTAAAVMAS